MGVGATTVRYLYFTFKPFFFLLVTFTRKIIRGSTILLWAAFFPRLVTFNRANFQGVNLLAKKLLLWPHQYFTPSDAPVTE